MDANFENLDGLEWLLEDPSDVVVYGLMVREFGPKADEQLHGLMAKQVCRGERGAQFEWTKLRAEEFRRRGLTVA